MNKSFVPSEVEGRWHEAGETPLDFRRRRKFIPSDADRRRRGARDERESAEPLALYVHWPFCISKCPYCDFNSHVRDSIDQDEWLSALLADLKHEGEVVPHGPIGSIFFGGGTPSLMRPDLVASIIAAAERRWGLTQDVEITLEANPSSVEAARFADLAAAGVNRVSLGLQALDDAALRFLGRAHDVREGLDALETAQSAFDRVSFDLIYALPGQSESEWRQALSQALSFGTTHLSLYQLTIEPGTRFAALAAKGELPEADPDFAAGLYELTQALSTEAGLPAYEISNHARPGQESRHNLAYWRYQPYLGVGPGAHGRRAGTVTQRHRKPENWIGAVRRNGHGIVEESLLGPADKGVEALLMGLRLHEGVDLGRIAALAERPVEALIDLRAAGRLEAQGMIRREDNHVRVTAAGMLLLDAILPDLVRA